MASGKKNGETKQGNLRSRLRDWEKKQAEAFRKERKPESEFVDDFGVPVKRLYTPLDVEERGFDYVKDVGFPGEYPFVRDIRPTGYRSVSWQVGQYMGHETPEKSNKLWKAATAAGGAITVAFDLVAQLGLDPDEPRAQGEVGRVGVPLYSLRDWEVALEGIDLRKVNLSSVINATGMIAIAAHLIMAERQGIAPADVIGQCQNDILKEHSVRGNFIFPIQHGVRLVVDCLSYCGKNVPRYVPSVICMKHYSDSGANRVHAAAFGLADGFAYFQSAVDRGVDIDLISPRVQFMVSAEHFGLFHEVAVLRAARKVYAQEMKRRFNPDTEQAMKGRWHAVEGGTSLTRGHYLANVARSAMACLAGALGGCERIATRTFDEMFGIPSQEACVTNVAVQHVVAQETGVTDTIDPLAGSYYVESLTLDYEEMIRKELETIDHLGGMVRCIQDGYVQKVVATDYYNWYKRFQEKKVLRVGENFLPPGEDLRPAFVYRADPVLEAQVVESVQRLRKERDNARVRRTLDEVKAAAALPASEGNNLLPPIMDAVRAYATVGEICRTLRSVWGEWKEPSVF
ncbi:MAG: methylmalonyl-CoA mutase [Chloroflexi bacterium]|nr:methylmalonyl-CoA mutase [Chloroflexota bacterium]